MAVNTPGKIAAHRTVSLPDEWLQVQDDSIRAWRDQDDTPDSGIRTKRLYNIHELTSY
jgi:hypothetical protein